jgi:hypothetical protein
VDQDDGEVGEAEDQPRVAEGVRDGERLDEEGGYSQEVKQPARGGAGREIVGEPDLPSVHPVARPEDEQELREAPRVKIVEQGLPELSDREDEH